MQAFGIKQKFIILIWIVGNVNALRWYTASVVESNNYDTVNSKPNFIQDGEFRYKPAPAETFQHQKRILANVARDHGKKINATTPNPASEKVLERNLVTTTVLPFPTTPMMNGLYHHIINETVKIPSANNPSKNQNIHPQNSTENQRKITIWRNYVINNTNVIQRRPMKRKIVKRCPTPYRNKYTDRNRKGKFLEVFQVVEFDHVPCTSSSGLEGVCLHEYECLTSGGQTMGECADGYGSCCVTQFSCGDQTQAHKGWFTNPGYPLPSTERLSCAITVSKASPDITQIRLDFKDFELLQPTDGSCELDQFVVSGQNINNFVPILCGVNNGYHIYLEVGEAAGPVFLSVQTVTADSRLFAIKVTQLTSADEQAAPTGCLQYYRGAHGFLESFNYNDKSSIVLPKIPSYLNNLNYAMCIERAPEACSVTYTNTGNMDIVNFDADDRPLTPPDQAGVEIFNCPSDWLLISAARLCGDRLNDGSVFQDFSLDAPVTDIAAGPIVVWFRSDGARVGRGFRLEYQQNPCTNTARK